MSSLKSISRALNRLQQPEIIYEPALCSRVRWRNSHCNLCQEGCAPGALQLTPQLALAEEKCTNCGLCISRCPNGVFWSRRRGDSALAQEIATLLSAKGGGIVVFGCARSGQVGHNIIFLPCLGRLTENLLIAPFASGATRVEIWWPECEGCAQERHLSHLETVLFMGRKLAAMVGQGENCLQVRRIGRYSQPLPTSSPHLSRREFLRNLRGEARQTVAALLPEPSNAEAESPWRHAVGAKRVYLLKLIRGFPRHIATYIDRQGLPLAVIEIGPGCVGCPVCATLCPTGALERREETDGVDIYFRPGICTGCQICQEVCLFQAVSISNTFDLVNLAVEESQQLVHLTRRACPECATEFLGINDGICPACRHPHAFSKSGAGR